MQGLDTLGSTETEAIQLLRSVAEQLKVPLSTIARQAELGQLTGEVSAADLESMGVQASAALSLVDSYLLGMGLMQGRMQLDLEPVSVSSLLVEAAHELEPFARQYKTDLQVQVAGKYGPVMAHREGLKAALVALAHTFLGSEQPTLKREILTLAVHRCPNGITAGVYGRNGPTAEDWARVGSFDKNVAKPVASLSGNSAGLFVSATIFKAMTTRLLASKYQRQRGLAATLQLSHQLSFV